ncbi:MAG: RDD family protein [Actinomycetota bacterium]|nr:RDD family protein [Actinomycetota bacterium]
MDREQSAKGAAEHKGGRSPTARLIAAGTRGAERIAAATGVDRAVEEGLEEAIVRAVESPAVQRALERALSSDQVAEAIVRALETQVADRVWAEILASDKAQMLVERIAEAPEVRAAIAQQGVGLLTDLGRRLTLVTESLDDAAERMARRALRRPVEETETDQVGLLTRSLAAAVDLAFVSLALWLGSGFLSAIVPGTMSIDWTLEVAAALICGGGIFVACWALIGQTPGMRFLSIRLEADGSQEIGFWRALARALAVPLALVPAGIGFLAILISDTRRGWHDLIAGTEVVYDTRTEVAPWATLEGRARPLSRGRAGSRA